jgi:hypothetical protein
VRKKSTDFIKYISHCLAFSYVFNDYSCYKMPYHQCVFYSQVEVLTFDIRKRNKIEAMRSAYKIIFGEPEENETIWERQTCKVHVYIDP